MLHFRKLTHSLEPRRQGRATTSHLSQNRAMEIRRLGGVLLRPQKPQFTFLILSLPSRCPSTVQWRLNPPPHRKQLQRRFASYSRHTARSAITTSAPPQSEAAKGEILEEDISTLDWLSGSNSKRTNRSSSPQFQAEKRKTPSNATESELIMNKGNSAADLLEGLNLARAAQSSKFLDVDRMKDTGMPKFETAQMMKDIRKDFDNLAPPPVRPPMRLTPSTGRTVHITPQIDVGKSFKLMEQLVGRNKIRATFNYQRFHERPGLKRKRLKSLRWRKRFMVGFKAAVNRVKQMKKQGW